ncbi:hypothetical protein [Paractinoplanes atraurantiacus]|uniref:hypothetical protein n=1 Tax=Paractinoplanes atraurantiacus TaxID=1036182 RepID=UPI0011782AA8|nr:hypothetical protein [Actinoplanes atraurantiacus]
MDTVVVPVVVTGAALSQSALRTIRFGEPAVHYRVTMASPPAFKWKNRGADLRFFTAAALAAALLPASNQWQSIRKQETPPYRPIRNSYRFDLCGRFSREHRNNGGPSIP